MKHLLLFLFVGGLLIHTESAYSQTKEAKPISYQKLNKSVKVSWGNFQTWFTSTYKCLVDGSTMLWFQIPSGVSFQGHEYNIGTTYVVDVYTECGPISVAFSNTGALVGWEYFCPGNCCDCIIVAQ